MIEIPNWLKDYRLMNMLFGLMLVAGISTGMSAFVRVGTLVWGIYILLSMPDVWKRSKIVFSFYAVLLMGLLFLTFYQIH